MIKLLTKVQKILKVLIPMLFLKLTTTKDKIQQKRKAGIAMGEGLKKCQAIKLGKRLKQPSLRRLAFNPTT